MLSGSGRSILVGEILQHCDVNDVPIRPVVLYPKWWVERKARGEAVWVLNPTAFIKFLAHEPAKLDEIRVKELTAALEAYERGKLVGP